MESDSSALIHHLNLQELAKEMFKLRLNYFHWLSGNYLFRYTPSAQRNFLEVGIDSIRRVFCGTDSISILGPKTWDAMSVEFKELCPLSLFKKAIKNDSLISLLTVKDICSKLSDCNGTRTHNQLVHKQTLNHLASLAKWLRVRLRTKWLQSLKLQISRLFQAKISLTLGVSRHLYISSPGTKWNGFVAIIIEEVKPWGREDIPDPCTERTIRCKKYIFNCKYRIDLANLVAIPYIKLCWTCLVDIMAPLMGQKKYDTQ